MRDVQAASRAALVDGNCQAAGTDRAATDRRGSIKLDPPGLGPSQNCVSTITKMRVVANQRTGPGMDRGPGGQGPAGRRPASGRQPADRAGAQQEMANKIYHLSDMIRKAKRRAVAG